LGMAMPKEEQVKEILERVKNRSIELHDALTDKEFKKIVSQVVG
jgi:isopropylmalate/homocitrate/citramalate synthase